MVPDTPGTTLAKAFMENLELAAIREGDDHRASVLKLAEKLEGSVRNTGIHAAGVIIAPDDITNYIPVSTSKDADLLVTQFDGKVIESAGMLKMDFLGLKTLTIIKDAMELIKKNHGVDIDIDNIPIDDEKTYELYQRGDTIGTFQFESEGMRMYLKDLQPTNIEDLIAMNALYRPGPMQFIPNFINRKHGKEEVEYPHELLEPILNYSYGIMVYQEQIMQTAQILAGYSLGGADLLRRAMGKKDMKKMAEEREKFIKGAAEINNIPAKKASEVFDVMEKFAQYGFNRSHSAAYSVVAYQTGYLKAHYPAEYMAAVLTNNMNDIKKVTFFIEEARKQGVAVLGPDVNESLLKFNVNEQGQIRFGLAAIKGTGEAAVDAIISEREKNGPYQDIFDFAKRINLRAVNKKTFESMALAGAFDSWGLYHRAQLMEVPEGENISLLEKAVRYGNN
ncbi:MAG: DNA polymerase III subunit alpha, partial [Hymenobacteraceae bacterium]|nr:DNA polymerase III subunit alpha [Hymenobacteraceae bacterium]